MKDLTKILKVGDEVYCTLSGGYIKITAINSSLITGFPIEANYEALTFYFTKAGLFYYDFPDAEPVIYPSKENRDWNEWEAEQKALQLADVRGSSPIFKCKCGYETSDSIGWCVHADCCNGNDR